MQAMYGAIALAEDQPSLKAMRLTTAAAGVGHWMDSTKQLKQASAGSLEVEVHVAVAASSVAAWADLWLARPPSCLRIGA